MSMSQTIYNKGDLTPNKEECWGPVKSSLRSLSAVAAHLFKLKHPFIMVGEAANFAMNVKWEDPTTVDLLVRASTMDKLKIVLSATNTWTEVVDNRSQRNNTEPLRRDACVLLKRTVFRGGNWCKYLRLWTEEAYGLKIQHDSFIQLKDTFQLWQKAEPETLIDYEASIKRFIPETYVPTLPALLQATTRSIHRGRRERPYLYADSRARLRALVMVNWLDEPLARELVLAGCTEEWQSDYLDGYLDSFTRPVPDQDGRGYRDRNMRIQCRRAARWASLDAYVTTGYNFEEHLPRLIVGIEDQGVNNNNVEPDVIMVDIDDRPFIPGASYVNHTLKKGHNYIDQEVLPGQAYPMEQFIARAERDDASSDYDAAVRAWLCEKEEESAALNNIKREATPPPSPLRSAAAVVIKQQEQQQQQRYNLRSRK
ncbi:hypothetical protein PG985_000419 [Apiospora marii]|uniref:Uncharacterized protein n=1 Tax=Apiospora marii TaxID=335849 RepID=A0ABR1R2T2_9PEZI